MTPNPSLIMMHIAQGIYDLGEALWIQNALLAGLLAFQMGRLWFDWRNRGK